MRLAAIDLGSNSFHLLVVEARADGTFVPVAQEKEMLRLGDVVARHGFVPDDDADGAVDTLRRFRMLAERSGADEISACATSAVREAANGDALVDRFDEEAGVRVHVISGRDEARLIFGAIRASVVIDPAPAVALDLGGGSMEVMVGDASGLDWATSVHLGVARLTAELVTSDPLSRRDRRQLESRVTSVLGPVAETVAAYAPRLAVGSSGTLCALARVIAARRDGGTPGSVNQFAFDRDELGAIHEQLLALPAAARSKLAGLEPKRADQIAIGSTIATIALDLFGVDRMVASEWALREGIVIDAIGHHDPAELAGDARAIRRASVLGLARRCGWDEPHSRHVAGLATQLFDGTRELHGLGADDRELLEHAALLHDIGEHIAHESHHKHTAYLVQNGGLRGFDPIEVDALASLARYHRRSDPKPSHEPFGSLPPDRRARVATLAAILRLADGLDRGHTQAVNAVDVDVRRSSVRLVVHAHGDPDVEMWGLRRKRGLFERLFHRQLDALPASSLAVHPTFTDGFVGRNRSSLACDP